MAQIDADDQIVATQGAKRYWASRFTVRRLSRQRFRIHFRLVEIGLQGDFRAIVPQGVETSLEMSAMEVGAG